MYQTSEALYIHLLLESSRQPCEMQLSCHPTDEETGPGDCGLGSFPLASSEKAQGSPPGGRGGVGGPSRPGVAFGHQGAPPALPRPGEANLGGSTPSPTRDSPCGPTASQAVLPPPSSPRTVLFPTPPGRPPACGAPRARRTHASPYSGQPGAGGLNPLAPAHGTRPRGNFLSASPG